MVAGSANLRIAVIRLRPVRAGKGDGDRDYSVSRVNFMVKLLRACVWMPWRKKAMKDVASCDKPRGDASNL